MGYYSGLGCEEQMLDKGVFYSIDDWVTSAGAYIRIPDMSDEHLINTIQLLENRKNRPYLKLERMKEILETRQTRRGFSM